MTVDSHQRIGVHSWSSDTMPVLYADTRLPVRIPLGHGTFCCAVAAAGLLSI